MHGFAGSGEGAHAHHTVQRLTAPCRCGRRAVAHLLEHDRATDVRVGVGRVERERAVEQRAGECEGSLTAGEVRYAPEQVRVARIVTRDRFDERTRGFGIAGGDDVRGDVDHVLDERVRRFGRDRRRCRRRERRVGHDRRRGCVTEALPHDGETLHGRRLIGREREGAFERRRCSRHVVGGQQHHAEVRMAGRVRVVGIDRGEERQQRVNRASLTVVQQAEVVVRTKVLGVAGDHHAIRRFSADRIAAPVEQTRTFKQQARRRRKLRDGQIDRLEDDLAGGHLVNGASVLLCSRYRAPRSHAFVD